MYKKIKNFTKLGRIYWNYKTGKPVCNYLPLRLWIEPTDRCNLACPLCINRLIPPEQKGDLDWNLFKSIIDQLEGKVCDINLFHRGEPLLHPKITDMVSYAASKGMATRIHTNATLLTREVSRSLLDKGLNYISFSFDGFDKETYERNRAGANFEQTLNNIINFLKVKKALGTNKTFTVLQIIDTNSSPNRKQEFQKQKRDFLDRFKDLPLNKVSIRIPHNWGGGISLHPSPLPSGERTSWVRGEKKIVCTFPWYGLTIFRDGKVVLCCQDYGGEISLGNAAKQDLKTIWNSKLLQKSRNDFYHKQYELYKPCPNCDRIWRRTLFGIPLDYAGTFLREAGIRNR